MPDLRREFRKYVRLATHTALGELFIPDGFEKRKGGVYGMESTNQIEIFIARKRRAR